MLWDSAALDEWDRYTPLISEHFDTELPVVDVGCGNGGFTRAIADLFPMTVGIDVSPAAVALAQRESAGLTDVCFRQFDATLAGATDGLASELGPVNVFVRGVFHILSEVAQSTLAENLLALVGTKGRVLLAETNYIGGSLGYLASLGATGRQIPEPLERVIRVLAPPGHFGVDERRNAFQDDRWEVVDEGPTVIRTIPLTDGAQAARIPGYFAVMAPRPH